jgi:hydrogenase nickel incorporation protein HypB
MCTDCGCGDPDIVPVDVHERILSENDRAAAHNRHHFDAAGVNVLNVMGGPGSGKTALLEATGRALAGRCRLAAINGDLATDRDGERLRSAGIDAATITTGTVCHLDAQMVHRHLHHTHWDAADHLFIENVGNLVCPAVYDLGQHRTVVVVSVTEGEDKPLKYPSMFKDADLVVVSKVDLLPHLPWVRLETLVENLERVVPSGRWLAVSATSGEGLDAWLEWLQRLPEPVASSSAAEPSHA